MAGATIVILDHEARWKESPSLMNIEIYSSFLTKRIPPELQRKSN